MASSSQPFLSIEDFNLNVDTLIFARYDNNMNVEILPNEDGALYIPQNVVPRNVAKDDVEDAPNVDAYISKLHLTNLEKHHATWKPYNLLVEISQNVTTPFTTTCDLQSSTSIFGNIATTRPNFNYFGHSHNYDATIRNFILLVRSILHLFSSINRLICPINRNNHQISWILKVFYTDIGVYFNVCTKIIYIYNMHTYVYCLYNESQN